MVKRAEENQKRADEMTQRIANAISLTSALRNDRGMLNAMAQMAGAAVARGNRFA
ncbi:hypothetical protein ETH_00030985 [Eimeria tenella]|uniref:Uncharacterized protein n=1 Tax=Eimeria tenella TaxID=5802 RepID=U6KL15_EIMTE|nr:hypothetical protein ETH_00030985 [Eimeria tenella]CDJ37501.1 hypothetical protein ETH_00030985 [Eimeria tenella]|eukprot:XP_013228339.1 hypothetical protein ETH_00030985 [Eimeria tenella]